MSEPQGRHAGIVGYALVAGAAASWGAQGAVAKLLLTAGGLPAHLLLSTRTALAALVGLGALAAFHPRLLRLRGCDLGRIAVLGIFGMTLSNYTYYLALSRIPVAMAVLLIYTGPLFVLAAGVLFLGDRLRARDVGAAVLTLVGAALVVRVYAPASLRLNAAGLGLGLLNGVFFAFYNLWAKTMPRGLSPWTVLAYALAIGALAWLPLAPPWRLLLAPHPPLVWAGIGVVTVFGTLLPLALSLAGLRRISATHASVTSTLEPVVAAGVALVALGEHLAWPQVAGGALVLVGIGLLHLRA